jgi:hypothetical protein
MSEAWTSPLAALVGAIVGGAASLAGTMLVNKQQMATNARMRLYDELLPNLERAVAGLSDPLAPEDLAAEEFMPELLEKVRRASAIAGRRERQAVHKLAFLWSQYESATEIHIPNPLLAGEELGAEPAPEDEPPAESRYQEREAKARHFSVRCKRRCARSPTILERSSDDHLAFCHARRRRLCQGLADLHS